jgi:cardiolipin synthase
MLSLPNALTLARLALVPVMAYFLATGAYGTALIVFLVAALTDFVDGVIARALRQTSALGAALDPVADKLNMLVATVLLAWQALLPPWLAVAIVARDVIIVGGAVAYRLTRGHVEMAPTVLSKVNTFIEFAVLLLVMGGAAGWLELSAWLPGVFVLVFATVLASGAEYVWVWGRKAMRESRP